MRIDDEVRPLDAQVAASHAGGACAVVIFIEIPSQRLAEIRQEWSTPADCKHLAGCRHVFTYDGVRGGLDLVHGVARNRCRSQLRFHTHAVVFDGGGVFAQSSQRGEADRLARQHTGCQPAQHTYRLGTRAVHYGWILMRVLWQRPRRRPAGMVAACALRSTGMMTSGGSRRHRKSLALSHCRVAASIAASCPRLRALPCGTALLELA